MLRTWAKHTVLVLDWSAMRTTCSEQVRPNPSIHLHHASDDVPFFEEPMQPPTTDDATTHDELMRNRETHDHWNHHGNGTLVPWIRMWFPDLNGCAGNSLHQAKHASPTPVGASSPTLRDPMAVCLPNIQEPNTQE